jgi:hypothetical protein
MEVTIRKRALWGDPLKCWAIRKRRCNFVEDKCRRCGSIKQKRDKAACFWGRVRKTDTCWLWTGTPLWHGYGRATFQGKRQYVHRTAIELHTWSPVPQGMEVDHLCFNRLCVNPSHLEVVSKSENLRRENGALFARTWPEHIRVTCNKGHITNCATCKKQIRKSEKSK